MNKNNYDKVLKEMVKNFGGEKKRLLLHSCCAPCSTAVLEKLIPFFEITVFYYNPNITESEEYYVRLNEQKRFLKEVYNDMVSLIEGRYSSKEFFLMTEGYEKCPEGGERCSLCFLDRLTETANVAKENGFDYFCTTLTVSPHKNSQIINEIGEKVSKEKGVAWLFSDFKKDNGYKRSTELAKEYGLYRQNYCGCLFSKYTNLVKEI